MIPYGRQDITEADIAAVVDCLRSDYLTQGPAVPRFEAAIAAACDAPHAVAMSSATAALHVALLALGVVPGDRVWTSPITFVASANAALYCGAQVDFVDIEPDTFNLDPDALEAKLKAARVAGRLPKVVIPVHMAGQSCRMEQIGALAAEFGFRVLEDASHAVGGAYDGRPVGACVHSDVVVFSFHPVKIITTGEGGMALTRDPALAERMARLRTHGIVRDPARMQQDGPWTYAQTDLGFNYRMTDIQAALGATQAGRLGQLVARRRALADRYDALLADLPLCRPGRDPRAASAWHLYVVRVDAAGRRRLFEALRTDGIGANVHYEPVYRQPYYRALGFAEGHCPKAEEYYARAISIPLYAGLEDAQQDAVVAALGRALDRALS